MKLKYSFLKLGLALMLVPLSAPAVPADAMVAQDGETIILRPRDNETGGAPRTAVPFFAEYYDTLSAVMLGCSESIGDVTERLTSTAGDWYETEFDTSDGMLDIPVSGESGFYTLTIRTSAGVVYQGEFNI